MRSALVLFLTTAALTLPASAFAAPVFAAPIPMATTAQSSNDLPAPQPLSQASAKTALNAYANYLQALMKTLPAAQQDTAGYVAEASSQCRGSLAPLTAQGYQVSATVQANLALIGQEIGDDLSITFDGAALTQFTKLSIALSHLHWPKNSGAAMVVKHFLIDQGAVMTLVPSNLCQDVVLVAATPQKPPPAIKAFLKEYTKASNAADASLMAFLDLLHTNETPSEHVLVNRIAILAAQVNRLSQSVILANATTLSTDLKSV